MYVCYIFILHSSIEGRVSCFHFLAVVTRAAINMLSRYLWNRISRLLGICQGIVVNGVFNWGGRREKSFN